MKNITLAIDDDLLDRARRYAANRSTTVNALVRSYLGELVEDARAKRLASVEELRKLADSGDFEVGRIEWSRDDLHGRAPPRADLDD